MSSGWLHRATQRSIRASSSSSISSKWRLATPSLLKGHSLSEGWSSGEWEGKNSRCIPSGTFSFFFAVCHPARSSTRMMRFLFPAPTSLQDLRGRVIDRPENRRAPQPDTMRFVRTNRNRWRFLRDAQTVSYHPSSGRPDRSRAAPTRHRRSGQPDHGRPDHALRSGADPLGRAPDADTRGALFARPSSRCTQPAFEGDAPLHEGIDGVVGHLLQGASQRRLPLHRRRGHRKGVCQEALLGGVDVLVCQEAQGLRVAHSRRALVQLRRSPSHPRGLPLVAAQALVRPTPLPDQAQAGGGDAQGGRRFGALRPKYIVFDTHYSAGWFTKMVGRLQLIWVGTLHPRTIVLWRAKRRSVAELARTLPLKWRKHLGMRAAALNVYAPKYGSLRLVVTRNRHGNYDYIVTNDSGADLTTVVLRKVRRWSIETLFRDAKQCAGLEACQCRVDQAMVRHVGLVLLTFVVLQMMRRTPEESVSSVKERWQLEVMRDGQLPPPPLKACPPHLRATA